MRTLPGPVTWIVPPAPPVKAFVAPNKERADAEFGPVASVTCAPAATVITPAELDDPVVRSVPPLRVRSRANATALSSRAPALTVTVCAGFVPSDEGLPRRSVPLSICQLPL